MSYHPFHYPYAAHSKLTKPTHMQHMQQDDKPVAPQGYLAPSEIVHAAAMPLNIRT